MSQSIKKNCAFTKNIYTPTDKINNKLLQKKYKGIKQHSFRLLQKLANLLLQLLLTT